MINFEKIAIKVINCIEWLTNTTITVKKKPKIKIKVHPYAVSDGTLMQRYVDLVERFCTYTPENIFEIGANYAQDADYLKQSFNIDEKNVYVFEPHPQIFVEIKKIYKFNAFELAVSNENGRAKFNAIDINNNEYKNSGISSLREGLTTDKKNFINVDVEMIRMDDFMKKNNIDNIDFLKLDVEGMNYEVLEGFGNMLSKVKSIQTEGEYKKYWKGQKLYKDMEDLLNYNGFKLIAFILSQDGIQSDSFWIQEKYLKQVI